MNPLIQLKNRSPWSALRLTLAYAATASLLATLHGVLLLPAARGQGNGSAGTIDPDSVAVREAVRDASIITDSGEVLQVRYFGTDAAGNFYLVIRQLFTNTDGYVVRSYAADGTLRWERERQVIYHYNADGTTTYSEQFSPEQTPIPITLNETGTGPISGLSVDAAGNVVLAYDGLLGKNLLVGLDSNGLFRWRDLTASQAGTSLPYRYSYVKGLAATPDGGAAAIIENVDDNNDEVTLAVRLDASGTEQFSIVIGGFHDLDSLPIAVADDNAGNTFVVSLDIPYAGRTGSYYAFRKFGSTGTVLAHAESPHQNPADLNSIDDLLAAQADAAGNLYVAGNFTRTRTNATSGDGRAGQLLLAYDANLAPLWRALGPQPVQVNEEQPVVDVRGLRLSPGGITVGGNTDSAALLAGNGDEKLEITRFAYADGAIQWHRLYQTPVATSGVSRGSLTSLQVDARDNVYATGGRGSAAGGEFLFIKYSGVGDLQFARTLSAPYQQFNPDTNFQLAADGRPAIAGSSEVGKQALVLAFDNPAVVPAVGGGHPAFFTGEAALGGGAYYLQFPGGNPFGYYSYLADPKYLYHFDLGYEYVFDANDGKSGVYFYDFASNGFFYTSPGFPFPYLYDFSLNSTVYYYPDLNHQGHYNTDGTRYFYVFNTGKIISK